jgi:DNA-binding PadR family transcriptional regulator
MSGYDIKSLFKGLSWLIDSPSYGSLYPTLHSLLDDGLATVNVESNTSKPPRKLYAITEAGRQELRTWLEELSSTQFSIKAFVRHLILADSLSSDELKTRLTHRRSQILDYLSTPTPLEESEENPPQELGQRLVHDYSTAIAEAELRWLESKLSALSQPLGDNQDRGLYRGS